jgi:hypothetical protein
VKLFYMVNFRNQGLLKACRMKLTVAQWQFQTPTMTGCENLSYDYYQKFNDSWKPTEWSKFDHPYFHSLRFYPAATRLNKTHIEICCWSKWRGLSTSSRKSGHLPGSWRVEELVMTKTGRQMTRKASIIAHHPQQ